ncbi:MAG: 50S ribosomal protein L21, partial [Planctomycetia bacterium]|nr:50S ribosomal protein L21 [Planctomycetia bacterium]
MYAVFEDGSRQYMVSEGDVVNIDLRLEPIGNMLEITSVLLISNGADLKI